MPDEFDQYDQQYREDSHGSHSNSGGPRPRHSHRAAIKSKLAMPGVLLILIGVFPLGIGILNTLHWASGGMTEQVEEMVKQNNAAIDANPKIAPADRQQQKDLFADIMRVVLEYMPVMLTINLLGNLLVVLGGINMLRVSGHGLAILGSVVAMVPFITSCCCFVGIPIGIWAIVLLTSKDVKAAFYPPTQLLEDQW